MTYPLPPAATPASEGPHLTGPQIAGLAAGPYEERHARLRRNTAMLAVWGPLTLLLAAMYLRFQTFVDRIVNGVFAYLFPAVIIAILATLTWWGLQREARGNVLGDRLHDGAAHDARTEQLDRTHHDHALHLAATRAHALDAAHDQTAEAQAIPLRLVASADLGRKIAADFYNVPKLTPHDRTRVQIPAWTHLTRVQDAIQREHLRGVDLDPRAATSHLRTPTQHTTPWTAFTTPAPKTPDLGASTGTTPPLTPPLFAGRPTPPTATRRRKRGRT